MQRSPPPFTRLLVFFVGCENKLHRYKRSRDLRCITPGIVQYRVCKNATFLAIRQLREITFYKGSQKIILINYVCDVMYKRYDRNCFLYLVILTKLLKRKRFVARI